MEIHQLRYFVAAAEEGSIRRAADRLHVSQPALSRQISALEDHIGVQLFDRVKKRIHLTNAGRFFLPKARQILCDLETNVQKIREVYGTSKQSVRVGFMTPFLDDVISPALKAIKYEFKDIEWTLYELLPQAQLDRLREGNLDIAILGNLTDEHKSEFSIHKLARCKMAAVLPINHPLSRRKQISLSELKDDSFLSLSNILFPGRRSFLKSICNSCGFEPRIIKECETIGLMLSEIALDAGVALLPMHTSKLPHNGCVFVRLKTPIVYAEVYAVTPDRELPALHQKLIDHLKSTSEKVMAS